MQHWNSYWSKTKSLNSFAEGEHAQGYVGEIASFWQTTFTTFPRSAKILDLATGNGGLAVLAQEYERSFDVSASDAALIDPLLIYSPADPCYQVLQKIHFHGNMPSENLTFPSNEFDRVISQFGFEYADTTAALMELNRVLKSGGKFIALVHHQDSFISSDCQIGLQILSNLTLPNGLLSYLQDFGDFCQSIDNKDEPTPKQQTLFKEKNATLLQFVKQQQSLCSSDEELDWYNLLVKELLPIIIDWRNTDTQRVNDICDNLYDFQSRLQDQHEAAWSSLHVERIKSLVKNDWSSFEFDILKSKTGILSWVIKGCK